jgi:ribulose kinase
MQVSQAEFAKLMDVSRKTVTTWKKRDRIIMIDDLVDVEASRALMTRYCSSGSKAYRGATKALPKSNNPAEQVTAAVYDPPAYYENPANLPEDVVHTSVAISGGASDLAYILVKHIGIDRARPIVAEWVQTQLAGWVGGEGLPESIGESCWPDPPLGYAHWCDHPLFTDRAVTEDEWAEAVAEAAVGG